MLKLVLLTMMAAAACLVAAQESHMAYVISHDIFQTKEQKILSAFAQEVDELQMNDINMKQKTDHSRLTGYVQNIRLSAYDFSEASVDMQVRLGAPEQEGCTNSEDTSYILTFENFSL